MSMTTKTAIFALMSLALAGGAQAQEAHHHDMSGMTMSQKAATQEASGKGVVKSVNAAQKEVVIAHAPIAALQWPAMTMGFSYDAATVGVEGLKTGDRILFTFEQKGNVSLLKSVKVVK